MKGKNHERKVEKGRKKQEQRKEGKKEEGRESREKMTIGRK